MDDEPSHLGPRFAASTRWRSPPRGQACFGGRRINDVSHLADPVGRKTSACGVLTDRRFIRCDVDAVDFIASDETLHPLLHPSPYPAARYMISAISTATRLWTALRLPGSPVRSRTSALIPSLVPDFNRRPWSL